MSTFIAADEAAARLSISKATLYAYVSRGMIASHAVPGARTRKYDADDVAALLRRKAVRRDPARAAEGALHVRGPAVLPSALTSIDNGVLRYRGHDVAALAQTHTLEQVAALLWDGPFVATPADALRWRPHGGAGQGVLASMQIWLARRSATDPVAFNLAADCVRRVGASIVGGLATVAIGGGKAQTSVAQASVAQTLAAGWGVTTRRAAAQIDRALVLVADHELNVSAFTGRCVASARSSPYMVVIAALAALQGHRHGGETDRCAAMLAERGTPEAIVEARLRRGQNIPGFGHPLYPDGDPRGRILVEAALAGPRAARTAQFVAAAASLLGQAPTVDFGLVATARMLGLPDHAALAVFAVGRSVGWLAHALEQYAAPTMIRPRARYVGARAATQSAPGS